LAAVAYAVLGTSGEAEDCVHDVLLRQWSGALYRPARGPLRTFLMVCVRNDALTRRRTALRRAALARAAQLAESPPEDPFDRDPQAAARVRAALAALPDEQRTVVELAFFGGRTQREIATALDAPLGTVKSRAALALRKLAVSLADEER
jgi:RNA polymerase sigma-70 factor (ECF subfamily)